jgi:hypothetical protein
VSTATTCIPAARPEATPDGASSSTTHWSITASHHPAQRPRGTQGQRNHRLSGVRCIIRRARRSRSTTVALPVSHRRTPRACPPFHRVRATARKATSRIVMIAGGHGPLVGDDGERSSNLARAGRTSSSTRKRQGPRVAQGDGNVRPTRSRAVSASSALPTRGTGRDRLTDVTRIRYARRWPVYR